MLKYALELIAALLLLAVLVRVLEPKLAFYPEAGETLTPRDFGVEYEWLSITTRDGERLRAWSLPHPVPRAEIIYFHGNGGNLSVWAPILTGIARQGVSVLAVDYRGYGASTGRPTERGLYGDVEAMVERFWSRPKVAAPVIYWGRSLGAVMAAYAATIRTPDGVILESGFADARSLVRSSPLLALLALFSTYRFPCAEFLQAVRAPVLVMHGDNDQVIPIAQGRMLFERITGPKEFFTIRGGDHNDLTPRDPDTYWQVVGRFISALNRYDFVSRPRD
jgi:hypothetical protein